MYKKFKNVSLQTKILGLVITLIVAIIVSLVIKFVYLDMQRVYENTEKISLQTAKTVSFMPSIKEAMKSIYPPDQLQPLTETMRHQVDAKFVVIINRDGKILAHPDQTKIGDVIPIDDSYKAVVFGGYYTVKSEEIIGPAVVGKAPIFNDNGQIMGVVNVGYLIEDIHLDILFRIKTVVYYAIAVVIIGTLLSILLARNIRKDILGLEPREIAALYRDRNIILSSINEGIVAVDEFARITLMNPESKRILNIQNDLLNKSFKRAIPDLNLKQYIKKKENLVNKEIYLEDKVIILNITPIYEEDKVFGAVVTFRDKTEVQEMVNALSEVRDYSEGLRAQTHEFTNKLYVVSGLIQLGYSNDAIETIQKEIEINEQHNRTVFGQIEDPKVQALLLGKIGRASEKKITFTIDENSSLGMLPNHIQTVPLTVILGNLIDNAFEEVMKKQEKNVSFFALDIGKDIIFEVTDNGNGIPEDKIDSIFQQGFSTKGGEKRGYGLFNVERNVRELKGTMEVRNENPGTTFTVYIPKT